MPQYDIRRRKVETRDALGVVPLTSTAIETRFIDLQNLRGEDRLDVGGLSLEAQYKGFIHEEADIEEGDYISPDSGITRYEVLFVRDMFVEHQEIFLKRVR
jgi:hypothetical protein